jgi:hypothetical protein
MVDTLRESGQSMGAEDFRVTLRSPLSVKEADRRLLSLREVIRDRRPHQVSPCGKLIYESPTLVAEAEVWPSKLGSNSILGFAVCHPESSVPIFSCFVIEAAKTVEARLISISEDLPRSALGDFSPNNTEGLRDALIRAATQKRAWWVADFGEAEAVILPDEAIRKFVLGETLPPQSRRP